MRIPDFQPLFRLVLVTVGDGQIWTLAAVRDEIASTHSMHLF